MWKMKDLRKNKNKKKILKNGYEKKIQNFLKKLNLKKNW